MSRFVEMLGRRALWLPARFIFTPIIDFIYPPFCLICDRRLDGQGHVCAACWEDLPRLPSPIAAPEALDLQKPIYFQQSFAVFEYSQAVQKLVHNMKYRGVSALAARFGRELAHVYYGQKAPETIDLLVPVPLHPARRRERGYNQARLIADGIAALLRIDVVPALRRIRYTGQQAKFDRDQRIANVKDAFEIVDRFDVKGKNIALVDDVFTTGCTVNECARELQRAGVRRITVMTVVRI